MKGSLSPWNRAESWSFRDTRHARGVWVIANADDVTGWWVMDGAGTSIGASGPETGAAGMAAADRAAMGLGWKLEGGPVDMPAESARRWGMTDAEQLARIEEAIAGMGDPASSPAERVTEIVATLGRLGAERQRSTPARVADLERAIVALAVRLGERE